ncbi:MAG TPA: peptidase T, partial [Bryobacterales bacterium]|nr:peptidase T [Bryobacterales bacterium]
TLDGPGAGKIDTETFSADLATVTFHGINIHPSIAKEKMVNAVRAAAFFLGRLPAECSPERTEGREGFLHPYQIEGGVDRVAVRILLRDFVTSRLDTYARELESIRQATEAAFPGLRVTIDRKRQYRNLGDGLAREPRAVLYAVAAHERLGRPSELTIIRGGTDGSLMTEAGLPTPNLSTGQHNPHSPLEWACLDEMVAATEVLIELARVWAEDPAPASIELAGGADSA